MRPGPARMASGGSRLAAGSPLWVPARPPPQALPWPTARGFRKRGEASAVQAPDWDWSPGSPEFWKGRKRTRGRRPHPRPAARPPPRFLAGEWSSIAPLLRGLPGPRDCRWEEGALRPSEGTLVRTCGLPAG